MKTRLLFTIICISFAFYNIQAQTYSLGLRTGYNQSTLKSDDESALGLRDRQSFSIGLVHSIRPHQSDFGVTIETGYLLKGVRIDSELLDYRFHYINAPILLDYYPTKRLKISAGPEIAYLADARNRLNDSTSVTLKDTYDQRWDVSGTVGVSYQLDFFVEVGARYNTSFTKFSNVDAVLNRRDQYSQYFQLFFSFKIAN